MAAVRYELADRVSVSWAHPLWGQVELELEGEVSPSSEQEEWVLSRLVEEGLAKVVTSRRKETE
jgi:hypothetical protein